MSELILMCGRCSQPVAPGAGFLGISLGSVRRYEKDERDWKATHPGDCHDLHEVISGPEEVAWLVRHHACAPGAGDDAYEIASERMQSWRDLTWWSAHLMAKNWLLATDWDDLLEEVADGRSTRILVAAESAA